LVRASELPPQRTETGPHTAQIDKSQIDSEEQHRESQPQDHKLNINAEYMGFIKNHVGQAVDQTI
jgi:hypothetical protein